MIFQWRYGVIRHSKNEKLNGCWKTRNRRLKFLPKKGKAVPPTTKFVGRLRHFPAAKHTKSWILDTNNNEQSKRSHSHTTMVMNHSKTIPIYPRQLLLPQLGFLLPSSLYV
jgi:hypothetical protein